GIRDFHVTGVQTCALPICQLIDEHRKQGPCGTDAVARLVETGEIGLAGRVEVVFLERAIALRDGILRLYSLRAPLLRSVRRNARSEERRVVRECSRREYRC